MFMRAGKSKICSSTLKAASLESEGRADAAVPGRRLSAVNSFLLKGGQFFILFRPQAGWIRSTHYGRQCTLLKVRILKCSFYPKTPSQKQLI